MRTAVVQFKFTHHKPEISLARAETFVKKAAARHADVVVFPEDFLTGPLLGRLELADGEGRYRNAFCRLARRYHLDIVGGSVIEKERGRFFNTCYYVDRSGRVLGRYRKVNLWLTEKPWVTPGKSAVVFDTRWGRAGLAICWDLAFPELFRDMFQKRVQVVFCPACWSFEDAGTGVRHNPKAEVVFIDSACVARAFENEMAMVFCNVARSWKGRTMTLYSAGRSQVTLPFKGAVGMVRSNREDMLVSDLDLSILDEAEKSYEIKKDRLLSKRR